MVPSIATAEQYDVVIITTIKNIIIFISLRVHFSLVVKMCFRFGSLYSSELSIVRNFILYFSVMGHSVSNHTIFRQMNV